jgi:hypothetical protein
VRGGTRRVAEIRQRSTRKATIGDDHELTEGFGSREGHAGARTGVGRGVPRSRPSRHRRDPFWPDGAGDRRASRSDGCARSGRPAQRLVPAAFVDRAGRDRACRAAPPPLCLDRGAACLCPACQATRPHDPGLFRARAVGAQGGRSAAADPRAADQPGGGQHGRQAARRGGRRLSGPPAPSSASGC